jgi:hypothetical protein
MNLHEPAWVIFDHFSDGFFDALFDGSGFQNGPKMSSFGLFWHPKSIRKSTSFPDVEKVAPGCQNVSILDPPTFDFACKSNEKSTFSKIQLFRSEQPFRPQKSPKWIPNGTKIKGKIDKNQAKSAFDFWSLFYRFLMDFDLQFGSPGRAREPTFSHFFAPWGSRGPKTSPQESQRLPKPLFLMTFGPPRPSKPSFCHAFGPPRSAKTWDFS